MGDDSKVKFEVRKYFLGRIRSGLVTSEVLWEYSATRNRNIMNKMCSP